MSSSPEAYIYGYVEGLKTAYKFILDAHDVSDAKFDIEQELKKHDFNDEEWFENPT